LLVARSPGTIPQSRYDLPGALAMMKLMSNPLSPYGRKVKLAMAMKGLQDRIEIVATDTNPGDNVALNSANPLAKIPCLVTEDGTAIFDSHVVCEYLDSLAPAPVLFPRSGPERFKTLVLGSLADGILDAALLLVYEKRFRPEEKWHGPWQARQQAKIDRAVDQLEKAPPVWGASPDYGHLTLACALGYLDFRHEGKWRAGHPKLVAWLDRFAGAVPAFEATRPKV
jgi:glutathione S-transferase